MIVNASEVKVQQDMLPRNKRSAAAAAFVSAAGTPSAKEDSGKAEETKAGVVVEISENLKEMYQEQLESAKDAAKAAAEGMEDMAKLLEIARRIARGDHVPANDEKKLAEYSSDLYQTAKAAAALHANEKHKKQDSLFEEEEEGSTADKLRELKRETPSDNSESLSEVSVSDGGEADSE